VWGFYNASSRYRGFRKSDATNMLIVPTTNLYIPKDKAAATSSGSSSGSLSTGAIAGIAVGAAAGAAVAAGLVWVAVRRRRQRLRASATTGDAALEGGKGCMLDPASSGSSHLVGCRLGSANGSSALGSPAAGNGLTPQNRSGSPRASEGTPLAELLERVASVEAAAATQLGTSSAVTEHGLLSAESLPPRLREFLVPPSAVTYCRWPNGRPQEIGVGATSRVYKAILNGE